MERINYFRRTVFNLSYGTTLNDAPVLSVWPAAGGLESDERGDDKECFSDEHQCTLDQFDRSAG